mmetsp:Transcript_8396/g.22421  ORF Transcript_8396/g.22421 Transcript_8396/m.22421 type:complete len:618 (-) Transcript_8396:3-1856(-)
MRKKKEASETIQVFARVRPLLVSEADQFPEKDVKDIRAVEISSDKEICLKRGRQEYSCPLDGVFGPVNKQEDVFSALHDVVDSVIEGVNATIFAYGQTGTGKTYTMVGRHPDARGTPAAVEDVEPDEGSVFGVIPRAVQRLFDILRQKGTFRMHCTFLEVYNENVYDLIAHHSGIGEKGGHAHSLGIRGAMSSGLPEVMGLTKIGVESPEFLLDLINKCNEIRSIRSTEYNDRSNRSHTILQLILEQEGEGKKGKVKIISKLSLVDLAGSEKWKRSHAKGADDKRIAEMTKINQSLTTLGRCISALADGTSHIPYRESKLTRILQDSLGGNCRTVFIVAISPSIANAEETYSTLRFADRAKQVMVHAVVNEVDTADVTVTQRMRYEREIERLKKLLAQARRESTIAEGDEKEGAALSKPPAPSSHRDTKKPAGQAYRTRVPGPVGSTRQSSRSSLARTSKTEELLRRQVTLLKQSQQNYEAEIDRMKGLLKSKKPGNTRVMKEHLSTLEQENAALRGALEAAEAMVEKERKAREKMRAAIRNALQKQQQAANGGEMSASMPRPLSTMHEGDEEEEAARTRSAEVRASSDGEEGEERRISSAGTQRRWWRRRGRPERR